MGAGELSALLLATALGNNLVLAQGLGADRQLQPLPLIEAARQGVLTTLAAVLVAAAAWTVQHFIFSPLALDLYAPLLLVLLVAGVVALLAATLPRWQPGYARTNWWLIACNSVVVGAALAVHGEDRGLAASIVLGLGCGAGFTAGLLLLNGLEQRLQPSGVPVAFRGLPLRLLNAGLLLLAISGFTGLGQR